MLTEMPEFANLLETFWTAKVPVTVQRGVHCRTF